MLSRFLTKFAKHHRMPNAKRILGVAPATGRLRPMHERQQMRAEQMDDEQITNNGGRAVRLLDDSEQCC
jgi:hypothetical protein